MPDPRFFIHEMSGSNVADLLANASSTLDASTDVALLTRSPGLVGIVDEEQGGIVAYAVGTDNAARITSLLNSMDSNHSWE